MGFGLADVFCYAIAFGGSLTLGFSWILGCTFAFCFGFGLDLFCLRIDCLHLACLACFDFAC